MNRELIVDLLRKEIQELTLLTDGFGEMEVFPKAMLVLVDRKVDVLKMYVAALSDLEAGLAVGVQDFTEQQPDSARAEIMTDEPPSSGDGLLELVESELSESESTIIDAAADLVPSEPNDVVESAFADEDKLPEIKTDLPESAASLLQPEQNDQVRTDEIEELPERVVEKGVVAVQTLNEQLSKPETSRGAVLGGRKVDDIKQAMSIGDRFRFQRELFNGNGEEMNKTINYLNQLATYDEVVGFLTGRYRWAEDNDAANDFFQLVRRKF